MTAVPTTTPPARRAGFWIRAVAWLLDNAVAGALSMVAGVAVVVAAEVPATRGWPVEYLAPVAASGLFLGYTAFEIFKAATPGKMILGLVIATPRGARADRWTLALRWSTKQAPMMLLFVHNVTLDPASRYLAGLLNFAILAGCLQALDEFKRTWHDEWSGTAVFWRPKPAPGPGTYVAVAPPPLPGAGATP